MNKVLEINHVIKMVSIQKNHYIDINDIEIIDLIDFRMVTIINNKPLLTRRGIIFLETGLLLKP